MPVAGWLLCPGLERRLRGGGCNTPGLHKVHVRVHMHTRTCTHIPVHAHMHMLTYAQTHTRAQDGEGQVSDATGLASLLAWPPEGPVKVQPECTHFFSSCVMPLPVHSCA